MSDYRELIATSDDGRYRVYLAPDIDAGNPRGEYDYAATVIIRWQNYGTPKFVADDVWRYRDASGEVRTVDGMANYLNWQDKPFYANTYGEALPEWTAYAQRMFGTDAWIAFVAGDPRPYTVTRITSPVRLSDTDGMMRLFGVDADATETVPVPVDSADGFVVVSAETCRLSGAPVPTDAADAAAFIDADMADGNAWARGDVYGWIIARVDADGQWDDVESVWGFYGREYAADAARDELVWHADHVAREATWIAAEAEWRISVPDVATMLAGWRTLSAVESVAG